MQEIYSLLPLLALVVIFWLLIIRPAQKRQRQTAQMQAALQAGDPVMLTSGVFGVVTSLDDERARVRVADGVELEVARAAIGGKDERAAGPEQPEHPEPGA